MIELKIISGTDRPNSNALRVSRYLRKKYEEEGVRAEVVDLQAFPVKDIAGGKYGRILPSVQSFTDGIAEADGLVFVCPEYNGGYPGILKLFIDYLPFPESFHKKPIALVGEADGSFGALRAVEQLQQVISYRNGHIYPERIFIPRVSKNFDEKDGIKSSFLQQLLVSQITNFVQFVREMNSNALVSGN